MKIALASDHAGYELKLQVSRWLQSWGVQTEDYGCNSLDSVDYPDFAILAAEAVIQGKCDRAILVCGTGVGMAIAANKLPGIRASLCHDTFSAQATREHNDSNVLCLGARVVGIGLAEQIVRLWVHTEFAGGRHQARVDKIAAIESRFKG